MQYSDALEDSAENDMPDQDFIQTVRLNEIFMPAASRERRDMFARQGLEFSPHALGVQFAHYTSADAAMKIIRSKRMWTRNAKCMSDFSEVMVSKLFFRLLGAQHRHRKAVRRSRL